MVEVLVDDGRPDGVEGRAAHQAPEVDGSHHAGAGGPLALRPGDLVRARVTASEGVDLTRRADRDGARAAP